MPINKCCRNIKQNHQFKYIRHEEEKRNILSGRKGRSIRNKGGKKKKNSIQQKI
jgi:hypothetical protein